ncbi:MAG: hypothetical protein ACNYPI_08050 [Arenicellales bacterium WSBS_2016_MAG_OTU3]
MAEALTYGVFKMNIVQTHNSHSPRTAGEYVDANAKAFKYQISPDDGTPYKKQYDPLQTARCWQAGFRNPVG